ncbi:DUF494 family protein [Neisseria leonii]|uniref:Protein Smg homolog n=1 Tax=Neisseria leonii TaxID=2995413 RepID=A0A9X4E1L8_9NEIS|nr:MULTISPECIES: DUF494 family protein [unclassified Neisseria]MDD9325751.1 DUF494 family protein [Neisseria sp. 3986]MDD9327892.1 DUF494 family protein [Neisseria sp. 51.81]
MAELIAFLIEHFHDFDACPPEQDLGELLEEEGFGEQEIGQLLMLVQVLKEESVWQSEAPGGGSMRVYWPEEADWLPNDVRGLLHFLHQAGALNDVQREFVIHALMNLPAEELSADLTKVITLLVLWAQKAELPVLVGDDLMMALHGRAVMQ